MSDKQTLSENGTPAEQGEAEADNATQAVEPPSVEALQLAVEETQNKADQYYNDLLRARADLENFRKRAQRDIEHAHKFGLEKLVQEFLPVKDSVELGLSAAEKSEDVSSLREGLELTLQMLSTAFERLGVNEVNPLGDKFDPNFHQAMTTQPNNEVEAGTVLNVVQRGYVLNERLMRPALVIVAATDSESTQTGDDDAET